MMLLYTQEPIKVGYHPVKFRGHRHPDSRDIVALLCQVISQDHVIKGSCDFVFRIINCFIIPFVLMFANNLFKKRFVYYLSHYTSSLLFHDA